TINDVSSLVALVLNDQGETDANSYTVTGSSVARSGAALISLQRPIAAPTVSVTLNAGVSNDTVAVQGTGTGRLVTLNMGRGNDTVLIGHYPVFGHSGSFVTINGQEGADAIIMNDVDPDPTATYGSSYTISSTSLKRNTRTVFNYDTAESLTLIA